MSTQHQPGEPEQQSLDTAPNLPRFVQLDEATIRERILSDRDNKINQPICRLLLSLEVTPSAEKGYEFSPAKPGANLKLHFPTCQPSIFFYKQGPGNTELRDKTVLTLWTSDFQSQDLPLLKPFTISGTILHGSMFIESIQYTPAFFDLSVSYSGYIVRFPHNDILTAVKVVKATFGELPTGSLRKDVNLSLDRSKNPTGQSDHASTEDLWDDNSFPNGFGTIDEGDERTTTYSEMRYKLQNKCSVSSPPMAYSYRHGQSPSSFRTAVSNIGSLSRYSTPLSRPGSLGTSFPGQTAQRSLAFHQLEHVPVLQHTNSEYMKILREMDLLLGPAEELNWSGKGQHVEFSRTEEIPLVPLVAIGHGGSALVDSVLCRRIKLARKTMTLSRRQKLETVIAEVEHLQRLRHPHIVQLVGSYTLGRSFSILLYPVADFNLSTLLERMTSFPELNRDNAGSRNEDRPLLSDLAEFQMCLSSALEFVHQNTTKHMDIKPQNILVRKIKSLETWRVYLADFGISKHFTADEMSKTDHLTPRSKFYCSPEVYEGESKGRSSDVFSMGCVFLEIETVLHSKTIEEFVDFRSQSRDLDDPLAETFHDNLGRVRNWIRFLENEHFRKIFHEAVKTRIRLDIISRMLAEKQEERPTMSEVTQLLGGPRACCFGERERYERMEDIYR